MNITATIEKVNYQVTINSEGNTILADEPLSNKGGNTGMSPTELLLSSLGACTAITLRMYTAHKQWNVGNITVNLSLETNNGSTKISRELHFTETVTEEQRTRLMQVAKSCPVSKILLGEIIIDTK